MKIHVVRDLRCTAYTISKAQTAHRLAVKIGDGKLNKS